MGLLDQLWDDTVAGPRPDIGLGKLRKTQSLGLRSNSGKGVDGGSARSYGEGSTEEAAKVTRSIMIVKPPGYGSAGSDSTPASPAGSTPPVSPFSGSHFDFEEDPRRMRTRRQPRSLEQRAPHLLTMCDI
ncbi:dormancy-associated protein homolog 3 isoform X2 [Rosa chinensis]|uniref:dormancy-associated protein homolog 3 isoform X2 n=1 Tax=Rosa chinensis TaxID=74649 RepID=UPI000D08D8A0|nr:dormancy-associated protein homolog 3 isoform X2 [Rosa chinensis]